MKTNIVHLQYGKVVVQPNQSTVLTSDVKDDPKLATIILPYENVSIIPNSQSIDSFLVTSSDTSPVSASSLIVSTR